MNNDFKIFCFKPRVLISEKQLNWQTVFALQATNRALGRCGISIPSAWNRSPIEKHLMKLSTKA
jgi:hypothetical protein